MFHRNELCRQPLGRKRAKVRGQKPEKNPTVPVCSEGPVSWEGRPTYSQGSTDSAKSAKFQVIKSHHQSSESALITRSIAQCSMRRVEVGAVAIPQPQM